MTATPKSRNDCFPILSLAVTGSAIIVSVLQVVLFTFEGGWSNFAMVALGIAVMNLFFAVRFMATRSGLLLGLVIILYCTQLGIFILNFTNQQPPFAFRLLQVAIALSYLATLISIFLAGIRIVAPINAILLMCSVAIGIFISEITLGFLVVPVSDTPSGCKWEFEGLPEYHSSLGSVYRPYSTLKIYYPDNPRGYFEEDTKFNREWVSNLAAGSIAHLVFPPDNPDMVRIQIVKAEISTEDKIQLNRPLLKVRQDHPYRVNFQARADSPKNIIVGFAKAHEPWTNLGLYQKIALTSKWQSFQKDFTATADDDNARIHFDVGGSDISVELSSVSLRSLPDGQFIEPDLPPTRYFVSFKFNALGCRGRDYSLSRPKGTTRILALGDSFTMGVGVHEEDTFERQLERILNEKTGLLDSGGNYDVINCGVSGYGTKEERLFYELFGAKYEPDLVLLSMVWNDDISWDEEVQRGYVNRSPGKLELLFYSWGKIQDLLHRRPSPHFTRCVDEILRLDSEVREQGARLVVIIFRNDFDFAGETQSGKIWNRLTSTVTEGLQGSDIPILDLGKALQKHSSEDLMVHQIDVHPNEIAHAIAAREIQDFLQKKGMLK